MEKETMNPMQCDPVTGTCEIVTNDNEVTTGIKKPIRLLYFTDPICSSCWGIEPQLRKLKHEYGHLFDVEYRMGGLLKSWETYRGSDVSGPQSVARHWQEAGAHYQMPIDGEVWNEDPLHSSYPTAIAFKAAQMQDEKKAAAFLRRIKEMVFMEKKNITRREHLVQAANETGLDTTQFEHDLENGAKQLFEEDLAMAKEWNVRGFPTIFFIDEDDNRFRVYGSRPYTAYEDALLKLYPKPQKNRPSSLYDIFESYSTVTLKEFALFYDQSFASAEATLRDMERQEKVKRIETSAGDIWQVIR